MKGHRNRIRIERNDKPFEKRLRLSVPGQDQSLAGWWKYSVVRQLHAPQPTLMTECPMAPGVKR